MNEIGLKKAELDTPFLWVDLDLLESNITYLAEYFEAAGVSWRPHMKGIKVPAIAHQVIASGAIGVTCAKLGEAEIMAAAGIQDILIANQIVGPVKIARLVNLRRHADVKVAVDNETNVVELGEAARAKGVELGILFAFTILTETVFQWQGMGFMFLEAVERSDTSLLVAYLVVVGVIFVVVNTMVDIVYGFVNPMVRIAGTK